MSHPAYHLRPNKAIDRFAMIDTIRRFGRLVDLSSYTYYGLGGPYLEDFRLLYELLPEIRLVSIEQDDRTIARQRFHLPCHSIELHSADLSGFLSRYEPKQKRCIFWLDYTALRYGCFGEFMELLEKVPEMSLVKLTLRAQPNDWSDAAGQPVGKRAEEFHAEFGVLLPDPNMSAPPLEFEAFASLLQKMVRIAAQKALPAQVAPFTFQLLSSFCYKDGAGMLTLMGVVCRRERLAEIREAFRSWEFANLRWKAPRRIDVPTLSTKERLHLQVHLPCRRRPGKALRSALGHLIEGTAHRTEVALKQYADYHRYYPYFMKAVP
jgi:hypothetical protein